jgi:putative sterol carrier protein
MIPANTSVKDLLLKHMPELAKNAISASGAATQLAGTEFTMVMEVNSDKFNYRIKDGKEFAITEGDLESPMVRVKVQKSDMEKMISTGNLDMLTGMVTDLSKARYNAIKNIKGRFFAELANDDGSKFIIETILNNQLEPKATFKMTTADSAALVRKEKNPVNLFMSGAMKIEGDMAFAMSTQPMFT